MAGEALQGVIAGEVGRLLCRIWDDDGRTDDFLARTYGENGAAIVGAPVRYSKRVFRDAFCFDPDDEDRPGDQLDGLPPSTGQCEANYNGYLWLVYDVDGADPNGAVREYVNFPGPIDGYYTQVVGGVREYGVKNVYGQKTEVLFRTDSRGGEWIFKEQGIRQRSDGLPDNCGSSPDIRPRYTGPVDLPGPNGPVSTPTTIIINDPKNNNKGRGLTIPFAWLSPELNLNGEATINAEGNLEIDTNPGSGDNPGIDPDSPTPPNGPDDPPLPGGYREIWGVVVVSTKLADATTTTEFGNGDSPNLYLPRCASLLFAVNIAGVGSWTKPVDIETLRQWVPVEGKFPAYWAVVKPMNGYQCDLYPVYVDDGEDESVDD